MNQIDAQVFFECASKSFNQLKAIFVALESEDDKGRLSDHASHLVGAGRHIAEGMAETVGCWADEAAEPWFEDSSAVQAENNKPEATGRSSMDSSELGFELCGVKALIDAADRAIWQDGAVAEDSGMVIGATYILRDASAKLSKLLEKT
ncbi:hypothetical protein [Flavobacterium sp.]|uniref:hypothetical protein n=1 Tax=Flavobacterium sp. TaxID=239 RepID=UPI0037C08364